MTFSDEYTAIYWVAFGLVFILLEVSAVSGLGFLFAGLSACAIAIMIQTGLLEQADYTWQLIWFLALTAAWAIILWKPMKKFQNRAAANSYQNIHGDPASVIKAPTSANATFSINWSGTTAKAKLEKAEYFPLKEEEVLEVVKVEGNVFVVKPHTSNT